MAYSISLLYSIGLALGMPLITSQQPAQQSNCNLARHSTIKLTLPNSGCATNETVVLNSFSSVGLRSSCDNTCAPLSSAVLKDYTDILQTNGCDLSNLPQGVRGYCTGNYIDPDLQYSVVLSFSPGTGIQVGQKESLFNIQGLFEVGLARQHVNPAKPINVVFSSNNGTYHHLPAKYNIDFNTSTTIGIQIFTFNVSLFGNGAFMETFNIKRTQKQSGKYELGYSSVFANSIGKNFTGIFYEAKIFHNMLTNREIQHYPNTTRLRIQSECRCPPSHPKIDDSIQSADVCITNSGSGSSTRRINVQSYPIEYINDERIGSGIAQFSWVASPSAMSAIIEVFLLGYNKTTFQVHAINITFGTVPNTAMIRTYVGNTETSNLTMATSCSSIKSCISFSNTSHVSQDTGIANIPIKAEVDRVVLELTKGRDNMVIKEVEVFGSCFCNFHGSVNSCFGPNDDSCGPCQCSDNTMGDTCDQCKPGFYKVKSTDGRNFICEPCGCVKSTNNTCDQISGQCQCNDNAQGIKCDTCVPGYYHNGTFLCQPCMCNLKNTVQNSSCDVTTGQCECLNFGGGKTCDSCQHGYYNDSQECVRCDCAVGADATMICLPQSGMCICKDNVTGSRCDQCVPKTYGINKTEGCVSCDCYPGGSINDSCDATTGECHCLHELDQQASGKNCLPYLRTVPDMDYGPIAGGTTLLLYGHLLLKVKIYIGSKLCPEIIIPGNASEIKKYCLTPGLTSPNTEPRKEAISLQVPHNGVMRTISTSWEFEYRANPTINRIEPTETFLSGGINLTVTGTDLDSVRFPVMTVTEIHLGTNKTYVNAGCTVISSSKMICKTPNLKTKNTRRKRDTRVKLNNSLRKFYIGFRLDGFRKYENVSSTLNSSGFLNVYSDPEIFRFEESGGIREYNVYRMTSLTIKGEQLDYGCSKDDYRIMVGTSMCSITSFYRNEMICKPKTEPKPAIDISDAGDSKDLHVVYVRVGNIATKVGYLKYKDGFFDNPVHLGAVIGGAGGFVLIIAIIIIVCCVKKRRTNSKPRKKANMPPSVKALDGYHDNHGVQDDAGVVNQYYNMTPMSNNLIDYLSDGLKAEVNSCSIDFRELEIGEEIGKGQFGRVFKGVLYGRYNNMIKVAIKTLKYKTDSITDNLESIESFLTEATIMRDFIHDNVLGLVGVSIHDNTPFVILPFMSNGDLKSYIVRTDIELSVHDILQFGKDIASGMAYLSSRKFVHGDLAARNCMVDGERMVKIADFGLSKDIYTSEYYRQDVDKSRPLPVKWMAIESLVNGLYTSKSDVWSYGIVLWELFTRGGSPYPHVNAYDIKDYLQQVDPKTGKQRRMEKPLYCPPEIYELMSNCWIHTSEFRPNFTDIVQELNSFLEGRTNGDIYYTKLI